MRVIPCHQPSPRLLNSVAPEYRETPVEGYWSATFKGEGFFAGNGRAIFIGIFLGGFALSVAGIAFNAHRPLHPPAPLVRTLLRAHTDRLTSSPHTAATPAPIIVQITPELVHVSAIFLGHPRLAIINGRQVAEGDRITLHTLSGAVEVTLQVVKIADGRIDLTDGSQTYSARLFIPSANRAPIDLDRHK
jgi:hypothetical protein